MSWLFNKITNFGDYLEKQTGGMVKSEDVASLADTLMAAWGVRGGQAAIEGIAKRPLKKDQLSAGDFRDEKPRLKLTDEGPKPIEELQQIQETAKAREATLNDEVTKPPKPIVRPKMRGGPSPERPPLPELRDLYAPEGTDSFFLDSAGRPVSIRNMTGRWNEERSAPYGGAAARHQAIVDKLLGKDTAFNAPGTEANQIEAMRKYGLINKISIADDHIYFLATKEAGTLGDVGQVVNRHIQTLVKNGKLPTGVKIGIEYEGKDVSLAEALKSSRSSTGAADPEFLLWTTTAGAAGVAAEQLYERYQQQKAQQQPQREEEPQPTEKGTYLSKIPEWLVGGAMVAGAIKGKGGMWHPEAVTRLADPLKKQLGVAGEGLLPEAGDAAINAERVRRGPHPNAAELMEPARKSFKEKVAWTERAVRNYLNKYAGTKEDPLRDIEVPFEEGTRRWEQLWDNVIKHEKAMAMPDVPKGTPPTEQIWYIASRAGMSGEAIQSHLSHVGDYLRQNVAPEKLQQFDLVRAVKETDAADKRAAAAMEKVQAASMKDMPVYKAYPDGYKWVELKLPEKLTEEQAKRVRKATADELRVLSHRNEWGEVDPEGKPAYIALGTDGKPIQNTYTGTPAAGRTPEEAHLAGQLSQEGNIMGHCVGGYCPGVASGESRIFSLRDLGGRSHVTIEVEPPHPKGAITGWEDRVPVRGGAIENPNITQIKGKQNRAPSPEYLPYVQDFVKGGKWEEVRDLQSTGLLKTQYGYLTKKEVTERGLMGQSDNAGGIIYVQPPRGERGAASPELLKHLAAAGVGAAVGAYVTQDPWFGGLLGAVAGSVGVRAAPSAGRGILAATRTALNGKGLTAAAKELVPGPISAAFAADTRIRIKSEMDNAEVYSRREELVRNRLVNDTLAQVKQPTRREAISHWLEGNKAFVLSSTERAAAERIRKWFADVGHQAQKWGVLGDLLDNYVTHVFGKEAKGFLDQLMAARKTGAISSGFAMQRTGPPTIAEVNAWMKSKGQEPITADIAPIIEAYGNSMTKAISNKMLVENLKDRKVSFDQGGQKVERPLVMQSWKAPRNYVPFGSAGLAAHPDIIGPLKFAFDADSTISVVRAIEAVNTAAKRSAVSFSLFHAKALTDAFAGATTLSAKHIAAGATIGAGTALVLNEDPITYAMIGSGLGMTAKGGKLVAQAAAPRVFGENRFIKALRKNDPSLAKMIDLSFEGGLMYTLRRGELADQELGGRATSFYAGLKWAQQSLDKILPGAGTAIKGLEKLNHAVDGFMWERLHTAMKLEIFAEKYETLLENNAKANRANPKVKLFSEKELAERAASFTNDIFGGLNWRRIAEETHTKWGRDLAMGIYGPSGRRMLRIGMFAPDWTISTTRAAIKAFGPLVGQESGTGVRGLLSPSTMTDLHWQYMLRSVFYYAMVGDGLNVALNGKHLWEEDDPTYIHLRDGRKIQYSKHTLEPYHWLQHPVQQALNKLGQIPKEGLNQLFGTEYLNPRLQGGNVTAGPTMKESRLRHAAQSVSPIGVQQLAGGGPQAGAIGAVGIPIYGKTNEERRKERLERQLETRRKRDRKRMLQGK